MCCKPLVQVQVSGWGIGSECLMILAAVYLRGRPRLAFNLIRTTISGNFAANGVAGVYLIRDVDVLFDGATITRNHGVGLSCVDSDGSFTTTGMNYAINSNIIDVECGRCTNCICAPVPGFSPQAYNTDTGVSVICQALY